LRLERKNWQAWDGADCETKASEANRKGYFAETFSQKEERHDY